MPRTRSLVSVAVAVLAVAVAPALALPPIYDRIPAEAVVVISTQNLGDVDRDVTQMFGAVELPALATPTELLRRIGLGQAIDQTKPMAFALMPGDLEADVPPAFLLVPTTDFGAMMQALDGTADGAVFTFDIPTGETLFARAAQGGYAVVGMDRELVAAIDGHPGNIAGHTAHVGAVGAETIDSAQLAILVKKPMLDLLREQMEGSIEETLAGLGLLAAPEQAEQLQAQAEQAAALLNTVFTQGRELVVGIDAGATGLSAELAMDFDPGSELAGLFGHGGDSSRLLAALPNQPYLFAYALDATAPAAQKMMEMMADANINMLIPAAPGADMTDLVKELRGLSFAVFQSPGGLMGGLLANSAGYFAVRDPNAAMKQIRTLVKGINEQAGDALSFSYEPNAAEIDSVSADSWSMSFDAVANAGDDPMAGAMVQQVTMMLFGPGGPGGYFAPGGNGIYTTMGLNRELLSASFNAEKGQNSLREDRGLSMVAQRLPENRSIEMFVGVGPILQQGLQMAAMFGMPIAVDVPASLPPVGMGVTTDRGGARLGCFVPAPVIKVVGQLAQQTQGMMNQGDQDAAPPF